MFDFAWSELALIAVVALVIIGPKDLPRVMRVVGKYVRQARSIAREFQGSVDQMMREAELDEMKSQIDRATNFNIDNEIRRTIDPTGELHNSLNDPVLTNPLASPTTPVERASLESRMGAYETTAPEVPPEQAVGEHSVPPALEPPKVEAIAEKSPVIEKPLVTEKNSAEGKPEA